MTTLLTGIDVSAYQPHIDWRAVAAGGDSFAFVKATEGARYVSPIFRTQRLDALAQGLLVGADHFARWERYDPEAQAEHFARTIGTCGLSLEGAVTSEVDP